MEEGKRMSEATALVRVSRRDVGLLRAAASLAAYVEASRRAEHLHEPLSELAERIEAALRPPLRRAA